MSTVNIVKYFFYRGSEIHKTTSMNGMHQIDPLGYHVTLCFKDEQQLLRGTHVSSHGYVKDQDNLEFIQATHTREKSDKTKRQRGKKDVWPSEDMLVQAPDIGYSHLPPN
ncbi:hypothetical protein BO78DRAFT_411429 [Aspergillus sclerotiicarbonarius CBS 121057]|uniref:Uncharacterized protein n=1 Tax=Aspergillus sclerotiicarbonarius (strain CBS 121057 / IBT 28362) TaxID=1448318 RepID=A0A319DUN4_ASPSB|nr:hypothetical protein BO78DRAFT_411429 [Aspergillus sclerotiicarbonarius CBS 121057]